MQIAWNDPTPPYDPEATRTGLTARRVYEVRSTDAGWAVWVRPRLCRTGEHGLAVYDWTELGDGFATAAVAIVTAQICEDGATAAEEVEL